MVNSRLADVGSVAQYGADAGVGVLHVEHGIVLRLLGDPGKIKIQRRLVLAVEHHEADNVGANLDLGNSAALGYDALAECRAYGARVFNVHIKDRVLGGTTVPVGTGHTDFERAFRGLKDANYRGDFILQTAPSPDYLGIAEKYMRFARDWAARL